MTAPFAPDFSRFGLPAGLDPSDPYGLKPKLSKLAPARPIEDASPLQSDFSRSMSDAWAKILEADKRYGGMATGLAEGVGHDVGNVVDAVKNRNVPGAGGREAIFNAVLPLALMAYPMGGTEAKLAEEAAGAIVPGSLHVAETALKRDAAGNVITNYGRTVREQVAPKLIDSESERMVERVPGGVVTNRGRLVREPDPLPRPNSPNERPVEAALRDPETQQVYTGLNHGDARDAWAEAGHSGTPERGYVSKTGRFIPEPEAKATSGRTFTSKDLGANVRNSILSNERGALGAKPETIKSATVRIGGKEYDGPTHAAAAESAGPAGDEGSYQWEGFRTSTGRLVGRVEAADIAKRAKQVRGVQELTAEELNKGLLSNERGVIGVDQVKKLGGRVNIPEDPAFHAAIENTPGAELTEDGLKLKVSRWQHPEQDGNESLRTGVFYLPEGSDAAKYYRGKAGARNGYGGTNEIGGETLIQKPLFVKGATGGKAPAAAYDQLKGKGAYEAMRDEVLQATHIPFGQRHVDENAIEAVIEKYGGDPNLTHEIMRYSGKSNQLPYAIQEHIVAHAVREAGFDGVLGYGKRKTGDPFFSEFFDVRESHYPIHGEPGEIHPRIAELNEEQGNAALRSWADGVRDRLGLEHFDVHRSKVHPETLDLSLIQVPKGSRKQGIGSAAMEELTRYADDQGLRVTLSPALHDPRHGTTSRSRLVQFYKRFGFVENKGRSKDFSISAGMIREPVKKATAEAGRGAIPMLAATGATAAAALVAGEKLKKKMGAK